MGRISRLRSPVLLRRRLAKARRPVVVLDLHTARCRPAAEARPEPGLEAGGVGERRWLPEHRAQEIQDPHWSLAQGPCAERGRHNELHADNGRPRGAVDATVHKCAQVEGGRDPRAAGKSTQGPKESKHSRIDGFVSTHFPELGLMLDAS